MKKTTNHPAAAAATPVTASPEQAYQTYVDAEEAADLAYLHYWRDRFIAAGAVFVSPDDRYPQFTFNGFEAELYVDCSTYEGGKVRIKIPDNPQNTWRRTIEYKMKSESGFRKTVRRFLTKGILD